MTIQNNKNKIICLSLTILFLSVVVIALITNLSLAEDIYPEELGQANISLSSQFTPEVGCFIELKINEEKIGSEIKFSLLGVENLHGPYYPALVDKYYPGEPTNYILRVYNSRNELIDSYNLYSGRFILWDNFGEDAETNPGGIIERDSGIISVVIPYNQNIGKVTVENNELETDLKIDTSRFSPEAFCIDSDDGKNYYNLEKQRISSLPFQSYNKCYNTIIK